MVAQSMGMEIHAYDPYLPPKVAKNQNTRLHKDVDSLFRTCTHISVHCNLTDETYHLVNYERMKLISRHYNLALLILFCLYSDS